MGCRLPLSSYTYYMRVKGARIRMNGILFTVVFVAHEVPPLLLQL